MDRIFPLQKTPPLTIPTVDGKEWSLSSKSKFKFTLIVFYRGYHCPICKNYIHDLGVKLPQFDKLGVEVIAISCDNKERATMAKDEWHVGNLTIGYALSIEAARNWGLHISSAINGFEPELFSEPAIFLVQPDLLLYGSIVQTMPFARPHFMTCCMT